MRLKFRNTLIFLKIKVFHYQNPAVSQTQGFHDSLICLNRDNIFVTTIYKYFLH